jgi:hypothetical protein
MVLPFKNTIKFQRAGRAGLNFNELKIRTVLGVYLEHWNNEAK